MLSFKNSCDGFYKESLDVRFTNICDNNCPFCIEKEGLQGDTLNVAAMIEATKFSGRKTVLILGGEPLLQLNSVLAYVDGIREYVNEIYITTSLPKTILDKWDIFCEIMSKINGLNVSLQHYNALKNNQVMCASSNHDRLELLGRICEEKDFAMITRVSINLVKHQIDNKFEIDMFLKRMQCIGVKHVKINELQNSDNLYVSFEQAYAISLPSPYAHGCQHDIKLPYHMRITLKRACFCVNQNLDANLADLSKAMIKRLKQKKHRMQLVLYESGRLYDGWQKKTWEK